MLVKQAKGEAQIRRFVALPGMHWIRAATFFVCLDTPWRFRGKSALYKYVGTGLERWRSGAGPERLRVVRSINRQLKSVILGAAHSAVAAGNNPFAEQYERWHDAGLSSRIAYRNVARSYAVTMWGMWKNERVYPPEWVGRAATGPSQRAGSERRERRIQRGRRSSSGGIGPCRTAKSPRV